MKPNLIILLGATKRVGKDTAAQFMLDALADRDDVEAQRFAFADALKREIAEALRSLAPHLPVDIVYSEDPEIKEQIVRPLLIAWGLFRRHQNPRYWIDTVAADIRAKQKEANSRGLRFVSIISDWRFPNESDLRISGAKEIKIIINRSGVEPTEEEKKHAKILHEQADFVLYNDCSLDWFRGWIDALVDRIIEQ